METPEQKKIRAKESLKRLKKAYPVVGPFVEWGNPLELVVGTMLSAQCTDERVNKTTKVLFKKYTTAKDYATAKVFTLEKEIFSCGFYRNKAKHLKGIGKILSEQFGGVVPDTLESLLLLPGVSHKTAYIVLAKAFGKNVGLPVDTHVFRLAGRLGWSGAKTPEKMSAELMKLFPSKEYLRINEYLITHGRAICAPRSPKCGECVLKDICPSAGKFMK
jgi:endonuclease-3